MMQDKKTNRHDPSFAFSFRVEKRRSAITHNTSIETGASHIELRGGGRNRTRDTRLSVNYCGRGELCLPILGYIDVLLTIAKWTLHDRHGFTLTRKLNGDLLGVKEELTRLDVQVEPHVDQELGF
jgi:hypothetical protein